ncbi:endoplasmic reticulum aminopeptidase 1 isoform X2 [Octopus vulgaris]|uniref:Endoplasmic reticulum aminopeptidase 1 isoform X2 n=1 Tax=Octopus vulgaris TaxID=6645 RepID=A0AA36B536_OCTVU|nr:endoplasmic reticulum aminopeptidase 1 isoform X2 [Octopus vulgaris]
MSTYLVSFVVSDFASVSGISRSGIKVHIFTPPQNINMTDLALESSIKILDFYEEYFEIPYPLPKIEGGNGESSGRDYGMGKREEGIDEKG